jgi:glutarate dioxygenase
MLSTHKVSHGGFLGFMTNCSTVAYSVAQDSVNPRVSRIHIQESALDQFLEESASIPELHWLYRPFEPFRLADIFLRCVGSEFQSVLLGILQDWQKGAFVLSLRHVIKERDLLRVLTAISYIVGNPRCDATGNPLKKFIVTHDKQDDPLLLNPYGIVPLHTDGTFFSGRTDWLFLLKTKEENANEGESTLLHIGDWEDRKSFLKHHLANHHFIFQGPSAVDQRRANLGDRGDTGGTQQPLFFEADGHPAFRFTYQYVHPQSFEEARYLQSVSDSLAAREKSSTFPSSVGDVYAINNLFWLHGRHAFARSSAMLREVYRVIGAFRTM